MNKKIYLDIKDLLEYVTHNTTYSGIQRVASEFLFSCFEEYPDLIVPVTPGGRTFLKAYDITILKQIHEQIISGNTSRTILDKLISDIKKTELEADITHNSVYFMIGAFWIYEDYKYIINLKRAGLPFVLFVHDLIQIRNREYVAQDANSKFIQSFSDVLCLADLIIANSHYVAADIKKFIDEQMKNNLVVLPEVVSAPLATEHKHVTPTFADHALLRTLGIDTGSYVLCVGTMEIRKNNLYLVKVWEQLIRIHGVNNIPKLVFCGKRGWHNEEFFDYIEDKQYVGTWLHLIESAPETLLSLLYEKSLFTCFVSYAEGWGLPISESLSYGKLCVASKTTSMPEVGGQFCLYIDPYDPNSGFDVINKLIVDKVFLIIERILLKITIRKRLGETFHRK
ncbi:glycosyltransferase family 4 protein [Acidithiobacillus caldus]|uniref:glycosyltransferase family 4 protein n=2 Tax=Acidithiobacillus caldus TaxID=33059 RepID=UPI0009E3C6AA|nr:glycosyltransferase family 1 protein [Acidithiobacillus caldus]MBU2730158.1 glycosyltransferase family 4 protein [Acidithiobacillus caldus]MBU2779393.1 glycosyltransferase family 4 protein [Acidithiobacillus caldus]